jgi:hypothetical protein
MRVTQFVTCLAGATVAGRAGREQSAVQAAGRLRVGTCRLSEFLVDETDVGGHCPRTLALFPVRRPQLRQAVAK